MYYILIILALLAIAGFVLWLRKRESEPASQVQPSEPPPAESPGPLHLGIKAYMREDYDRAEPIMRYHAEAGELKAQQLLAKMYYSGHGVPQSQELYLQWLQRAADQGDKAAKARIKAASKGN